MHPLMYLDLARDERRERLTVASATPARRLRLRRSTDRAPWRPPDTPALLRGGHLVLAR